MNGYMTIKDASEKWNIGLRRINTLCNEGRIEGASKVGNVGLFQWMQRSRRMKKLRGVGI